MTELKNDRYLRALLRHTLCTGLCKLFIHSTIIFNISKLSSGRLKPCPQF